jgi:hypothetical protein
MMEMTVGQLGLKLDTVEEREGKLEEGEKLMIIEEVKQPIKVKDRQAGDGHHHPGDEWKCG